MPTTAELVQQLQDPNPNKRYEACEYLRVRETIPSEAIQALESALRDSNRDVAEAARSALAVHAPLTPSTSAPYGPAPVAKAPVSQAFYPPAALQQIQMPLGSANSPEYIFALEKRLMLAEQQIRELHAAIEDEPDRDELPNTALLSGSFINRAFAVWGHVVVAQLILAIPIWLLIVALGFALGR